MSQKKVESLEKREREREKWLMEFCADEVLVVSPCLYSRWEEWILVVTYIYGSFPPFLVIHFFFFWLPWLLAWEFKTGKKVRQDEVLERKRSKKWREVRKERQRHHQDHDDRHHLYCLLFFLLHTRSVVWKRERERVTFVLVLPYIWKDTLNNPLCLYFLFRSPLSSLLHKT